MRTVQLYTNNRWRTKKHELRAIIKCDVALLFSCQLVSAALHVLK